MMEFIFSSFRWPSAINSGVIIALGETAVNAAIWILPDFSLILYFLTSWFSFKILAAVSKSVNSFAIFSVNESVSPFISSFKISSSLAKAFSLLDLTAKEDFSMNTIWSCIASKMSAVVKIRFGVVFHASGIVMFSLFKSGYLRCLSENAPLYGG